MKFRALRVLNLTDETAAKLTTALNALPGIEEFTISVERGQFYLAFDETQLHFSRITQAMAKAGCPLHYISVVVFD